MDLRLNCQVTSEIWPGVHGVLQTHVGSCGSKTSRSRKQFIETSVCSEEYEKNKGKIENLQIPQLQSLAACICYIKGFFKRKLFRNIAFSFS